MLRICRRFGAVVLAGFLSLCVVFATPQTAAALDPGTGPVVAPASLMQTTADLCTSGTAAGTGCVVAAGVASFTGTCWVLGKMFNDPSGCLDGAGNILNGSVFSYLFGSGGDNRSAYTGPTAIINDSSYAGALKPFDLTFFGYQNSLVVQEWLTVVVQGASGGARTMTVPVVSGQAYTVHLGQLNSTDDYAALRTATNNDSRSTSSGSCVDPCFARTATMWHFETVNGVPNQHVNDASETFDTGLGTPWNVTYSETCVNDHGASVVSTKAETFTPVPGAASPGVTLPACSTLCDQCHALQTSIDGGRANITSPDPGGVDVKVGGFTPDATTSYPLCTTKAPPGGCWVDLQRAGKSCFAGGVYCAGWLSNESRWDMSCEWGPYELPIARCEEEYGTRFDTESQAQPTPSPSVGLFPGTGTNPDTQPNPEPEPALSPSQAGSSNCWGSGWSWNPVSWVFVPVKCALSWAFVPTDPPSFTDIASPLPAGWIPSMDNVPPGQCGPINLPSISLGPLDEHTGSHLLVDTCVNPWPIARDVTYYGTLAALLVSASTRAYRMVMSALGMAVENVDLAGKD